jgi:hypothetical protein
MMYPGIIDLLDINYTVENTIWDDLAGYSPSYFVTVTIYILPHTRSLIVYI